jgi:transposase InsO family protein
LLVDLEVVKIHSRPYVSNDNPISESHFKTFKYRPDFPDRFGCIEDARAHCQTFFAWYNTEHRHSGIATHRSLRRRSRDHQNALRHPGRRLPGPP